jgi:CDP-diacylglycerol---glycerol-3-phosphate 3-phosphatidyltransferase
MASSQWSTKFFLVQFISISRAIAGMWFVSTALTEGWRSLSVFLYVYASLSDLLDGFLARRFNCSTEGGRALDLFGDKYLSIASALYAVAIGMPAFPCAVIILREIFLLSIRSVHVDNQPVIPPTRILGGVTVLPLRFVTLLLLLSGNDAKGVAIAGIWLASIVSWISLSIRVWKNRRRLVMAFEHLPSNNCN